MVLPLSRMIAAIGIFLHPPDDVNLFLRKFGNQFSGPITIMARQSREDIARANFLGRPVLDFQRVGFSVELFSEAVVATDAREFFGERSRQPEKPWMMVDGPDTDSFIAVGVVDVQWSSDRICEHVTHPSRDRRWRSCRVIRI